MPSSLPIGTLDRLLESIIARTPRAGAVAKAPAKRGLIEFPAPTRKVDVLKADPFNSRLRLSCPLPHPDRGGHLMWIMAIIHAEALAKRRQRQSGWGLWTSGSHTGDAGEEV